MKKLEKEKEYEFKRKSEKRRNFEDMLDSYFGQHSQAVSPTNGYYTRRDNIPIQKPFQLSPQKNKTLEKMHEMTAPGFGFPQTTRNLRSPKKINFPSYSGPLNLGRPKTPSNLGHDLLRY